MPKERRNLIGNIIATKANWTNNKIIVWLDNSKRKEQEEYDRLEAEFIANGNRHRPNRQREVWARVGAEVARDAERYIL